MKRIQHKIGKEMGAMRPTPCCSVHGARCTNVYAICLLPSALSCFGKEASELGFFASLKSNIYGHAI